MLIVSTEVFAQDVGARVKPPAPGFFLTTIPIRCVLRDYNIGFAKRIGWHHTLEMRVGYVHKNDFLHEYYEGWLTSTEMHFRGPSVYFQLNKWIYNKNQQRYYVGLIAGYRYLSYHDKSLWKGGMGGSSFEEEPVLSQWRNDLLILGAIGFNSTRVTTTEISIGIRVMHTYTNVVDTRFHPANMTTEEYDSYRANQVNSIPNAQGITLAPLIRITSRVGWFGW